jgi:hypothetical protein
VNLDFQPGIEVTALGLDLFAPILSIVSILSKKCAKRVCDRDKRTTTGGQDEQDLQDGFRPGPDDYR